MAASSGAVFVGLIWIYHWWTRFGLYAGLQDRKKWKIVRDVTRALFP